MMHTFILLKNVWMPPPEAGSGVRKGLFCLRFEWLAIICPLRKQFRICLDYRGHAIACHIQIADTVYMMTGGMDAALGSRQWCQEGHISSAF